MTNPPKPPSKPRGRTSFSFEKRHELPGGSGDFYDMAGQPTLAFETAHDAQVQGHKPQNFGSDPGGTAWALTPRKERLRYSDPHPPYALPAKEAPDEVRLRRSETPKHASERAAFNASRTRPPQRSRKSKRSDRDV